MLDASAAAYLKDGFGPALVAAVNDTAAQVAPGLGGFLEDSFRMSTSFSMI